MLINLNVKIKGGPRTPIEVEVYRTAAEKTIKFGNGHKVSTKQISNWIVENLTTALEKIQKASPSTSD